MKKVALVIAVILLAAVISLNISAQGADAPLADEDPADAVLSAENTNYAGEKTLAEQAQEYVLQHWHEWASGFLVLVGTIILAKIKSKTTKTLDECFGDKPNPKNIPAMQQAANDTQSEFMNNASTMLTRMEGYAQKMATFTEVAKETEDARDLSVSIALACQKGMDLMASQFLDLVLSSPSVGAKKKADIESAWVEQKNEMDALVEKAVTLHDGKE